VNIQGRHILLEKVRLQAMEATLSKLPQQSSVPKKSSVMLAGNLMLPKLPPARKTDRAMKLAMSTPPSKGYVLDYVTLAATVTNQTFQGDTTYYVSSYTSLSGGPFVIEGGTVIKFARGAALDFFSPFSCNTAPYRPAILTAVDDNSVGETISGSTGTPSGTYAYIAIAADGTSNLTPIENLHVKYADWGVAPYSSVGPDIVRNCQFVNNTVAILPQDDLAVENVLFDHVDTAFDSMGSGTVSAAFVTAHHVNTLNNYCSLNVTNSLFVCVTNWGTSFSGAYNATNASDAGVFQTVGGGGNYLAASSPYRDIGTTNISSTLLDDLRTKTTYPPIAYTNATFNTATTFSPQAERDTNTPDLGYHYDPLDYTFGGCAANSNLTFTAGTAVGWFRTTSGWYHAGHGLHVEDQQSVSFQGTATDPCYWVRLNTVQEQDKTAGYGPGGISSWINSTDVSHWPTMRLNWTKCSLMAGEGGGFFRDDWGYLIVRATACEFSAGNAGGYGTSMDFTNCLLDRTYFANVSGAAGNEVVARNCTVHGGFIQMNTSTAFPISIQNCALDGTRLDLTGYAANSSYASYSYNAFTNSTNPFPFGGNNVVVTNFNWQSSWLGDFYLPSASPLIDAGSTTAGQAGLYHFTTQTNQAKEASSQVDIGYHYVALNSNGEPIDTDGDGIPDYLEDANGNGVADSSETSWTNADTDGDGLTDYEELKIPIDADNPSLGHLDPLQYDTGGTGVGDGQKDSDHDGISNLGELRNYGSSPAKAHTFNAVNNDALYLFTARPNEATTKAGLSIADLGGGLLQFTVSNGGANGTYDIYYVNNLAAQRWQWRCVYTGVQCDGSGSATFLLTQPDPNQGYFVLLSAADTDGDGLTDGYEAWFNYGGQQTLMDVPDTDRDGMYDNWEVEYGLNPTVATGNDGASANPDGDLDYDNTPLTNLKEYNYGGGYTYADYDPLEVYNTSANRPVIYVYTDNSYPSCEESSFTIYRSIPYGGNDNNALTVYYSVGGTLSYDASDYTLTPAPPGWPAIYSATIPAGSDHVTVSIDAPGISPNPGDVNTVAVALTPYSTAASPQDNDPYDWGYVLDWHDNRATITYDNQYMRPTANYQYSQTCPDVSKTLVLQGYDSCGKNLTFSIVSGPSHGSLGTITSIDASSASVIYTPNSSFCGQDSFTYKVNDGVRDSDPATVTIDVGDPSPVANCQDVMTGLNTPVTFTLSGSHSCGGNMTFAPVSGSGPNDGSLGAITQIDANDASVTYTPNNDVSYPQGFVDGFDFAVDDCRATAQNHVTINVVAGPVLSTECRSDRILLHWTVPQWLEDNYGDYYFSDFRIYRCDNGPGCTPSGSPYAIVADSSARTFVDTDVQSGVTYCYAVTFTHLDVCDNTTVYESPLSNISCSQECSPPVETNGIDVAFIVDNTGSMENAPLTQLRNGIAHVLDDIESASGGNYRLALVTPDDDQVNVRLSFSDNNRVAFVNALNAITQPPHGGDDLPESTDECLNTIVNALTAASRSNPRDCTPPNPGNPLQINDFTPGFRADSLKLVVIITDHEPGGFCDTGDGGGQAAIYTQEARNNCIHINAVQVSDHSDATPIMQNYYQTSCGWYEQTDNTGTDIADDVARMLYVPGYCNCQ
jgi:hypothetical protein